MDGGISRQEHEEFARRIDAENERQNKRITLLEGNVQQMNDLTVSVKEMAVTMGNMLEEQKKQGDRLEKLEREPGEAHRQIKAAIITAAVSSIMGAIMGAVLVLL